MYARITHLGETKVAENTPACSVWPVAGVKEKVCGFNISVHDIPGMDVTESAEKVAKIGLKGADGGGLKVVLHDIHVRQA